MTEKTVLNEKHTIFVEHIMQGKTSTDAAKAAGYTDKSAGNMGYKLLQRDDVKARIKERREELMLKTEINTKFLMKELKLIIISKTEKTADRLKAIELSGRYLGMWDGSKSEDTGPERGFSTYARISELVRKRNRGSGS